MVASFPGQSGIRGGRRRPFERFPVKTLAAALAARSIDLSYFTKAGECEGRCGNRRSPDDRLKIARSTPGSRISPPSVQVRVGAPAGHGPGTTVPADRVHREYYAADPGSSRSRRWPRPCRYSGCRRGIGQVTDDPLDRKIVENAAVNHEPGLEPPLGAAAALAAARSPGRRARRPLRPPAPALRFAGRSRPGRN